jgi:hypothetical protein
MLSVAGAVIIPGVFPAILAQRPGEESAPAVRALDPCTDLLFGYLQGSSAVRAVLDGDHG